MNGTVTRRWGPAAVVSLTAIALTTCGPKHLPPALGADGAPLTAVMDSATVARGRYLANGPAHCVGCHTPEGPLAPLDPNEPPPMIGGYAFGVPGGTVRAPNLTPDPETGIGERTDAELVQALRYGRRPDGSALLPFMELQGLSDEDLVAVLSYLRSLPAVRSEVQVRDLNVFGSVLIGLFVGAKGPSHDPPRRSPRGPSIERGAYLVNDVASCAGCHTRRSRTGGYKGPRLSGGYRMADEVDASQVLVTPNLTPDSMTGHIAQWTEDDFVARFRAGRRLPGSPMPWDSYALMREDDLRAIYRYLRSLAPVRHDVAPIVRAKD